MYLGLGRFTPDTDSYEPDVVSKVKTWGQGPALSGINIKYLIKFHNYT